MAADKFGCRVNDNVGSPLERLTEVRRRHRVVDDERNAVLVGNGSDAFDVDHVVARVRQNLAVEGPGVRLDGRFPLGQVVGVVHERDLDTHLRHRVVQLVVGASVERRGGNNVIADLSQVHNCHCLGRLPR